MARTTFEEYKFKYVYEFADIVYKLVNDGQTCIGYDEAQFIECVTKFNRLSVLRIFIYNILFEYYNESYHDDNDIYSEETTEYDRWLEIAKAYNVNFATEFVEADDANFYKWYKDNHDSFDDLFQTVTDEVFYVLFGNHDFLVKFNILIAEIVKNEDGQRDWDFPQGILSEKGTINRLTIPMWVKNAVFHRDHGKCVFCGRDLTSQWEHSNKINYDHIVPLNKYGANDPCNIQLTCENCNKRKSDKNENPEYKYEPWF